ncbi:flagellar basal body-associated FliL family protein [Salipaludibacillus agaradhaerens]|uniref:flagellar basal body-associated FliL family protein n=1 Tax=Salipaludibacillus agaradhaerens TaxID=76935 RepID=UPI0021510D5F|nr:flagellar basal body-associated FliL family protein [Salipaludibacillus agaradhaerens]MCR6108107.1 flagellar basal body-associated FliL family protein [Salipaludibacillus agaradhaerens]MCR6120132.1 flagellar basal body-associated FliL family protein [Salipaludibacillus agaradhaerens]
MAEEMEVSETSKTQTGKRRLVLILSASLLALIILVSGVVLIAIPNEKLKTAYADFTKEEEWDRIYHLEENGYMLDNGQFIRVSFAFVVTDSSQVTALSDGQSLLKYTITDVISGKKRSAFRGPDQLRQFEEDIKESLNKAYSDVELEHVYITSFVIS